MSDDLKQNLRGSCYLAFEDGTNDYETAPEAADRIDELEKQNASLEAAIKRQASAARTLRSCALAEVQHLSEMDRSEYFAAHTLDSERDANAILTDRIEELEAKLAKAMVGLVQSRDELDQYSQHEYPSDHPVHERYRQRDYDANPARATLAELKGQDDE